MCRLYVAQVSTNECDWDNFAFDPGAKRRVFIVTARALNENTLNVRLRARFKTI